MFFLIGHRGVGKTTLVSRIEGGLDLDCEISKEHKIASFFENEDESGFRDLEKKILRSLLERGDASVISLGAGFELDKFDFPEDSKFIWLQRRSDLKGRIFLDRPRLNRESDPLDEYFERFAERQKLYKEISDTALELSEGGPLETPLSIVKDWVKGEKFKIEKAYYTIQNAADLDFFTGQIEVRTDLIDKMSILSILKNYSENKYILAIRTEVSKQFFSDVLKFKNVKIDVPIENKNFLRRVLQDKEARGRLFLSSHERLSKTEFDLAVKLKLHLKWAPRTENFEELKGALKLVNGRDVSFLPRSKDFEGRWKWVRESLAYKNKVNFCRSGMSEYMDQITIQDLQNLEPHIQNFKGAVLGVDVFLSKSPGFHGDYFKRAFSSFYSSIQLDRTEFNIENINFIKSLGYRFYSVTSPFKDKLAFLGCRSSVNTMFLGGTRNNRFTDTDKLGLKAVASNALKLGRIVIWGSGAMGKALASLLGDQATLISTRSYQGSPLEGCDVLIWSAGPDADEPLFQRSPNFIFDLEYKEHSRAREVALSLGTQYVSGEQFFIKQAEAQQFFWSEAEKGER